MVKIEVERVSTDYGFEGRDAQGSIIRLDSSVDNGGKNFGVRPMQSLLMALGSCSGIDIVSILSKQKQTINSFKMKIEGEREAGREPSLWKLINIEFLLGGIIDPEKAKRACQLSIEKYCSVAETLRRAGATINWTVRVNDQVVS